MKFHKDKLCLACVKGKQTKSSFKLISCFSVNDPFNLLHMDLFGLVRVKYRSGKRFTLVIVEEFSRVTWVLFFQKKSHATDEIISFFIRNELLYDRKIKQL